MDSAIDNHQKIGKKFFFEYRREKAAIEFRKALSIDPNNSEVIGWLALSLALQEKFDEEPKKEITTKKKVEEQYEKNDIRCVIVSCPDKLQVSEKGFSNSIE